MHGNFEYYPSKNCSYQPIMKPSRKTKPGIEKSHWKVGDADGFQSLDSRQDTYTDIEPAPSDEWDLKDGKEGQERED